MKIPHIITTETNNFDFLRLVAAFLVFFGHEILVTRSSGFLNWNGGVAISAIGVNIFFIISGFLIANSWVASPNLILFLKKRILRIYPGLVVLGLVTVFILGPSMTIFSFSDYFQDIYTINYIKNILLFNLIDIRSNVLTGVFTFNKLPSVVNASLWTVPVELGCYLSLLMFGILGLLKKRLFIFSMWIVLLILSILTLTAPQDNFQLPYSDIIRLITYFFSGIAIYLYKDSIALSTKTFTLLLIVLIGSAFTTYFALICFLTLPIILILGAFSKISLFKKITNYGDFSYGFYLYAFPVQQTVSHILKGDSSFFKNITISFILTMFLAVLSWYFIEKPFLSLKRKNLTQALKKTLWSLCKK